MEKIDYQFKLVVLGETGVGKTNLLYRYTKDQFSHNTPATIGVEFLQKKVNLEGNVVCVNIWDTVGQERFRSLSNWFYRGVVGAVLVYDVTQRDSLTKLTSWYNELMEHSHSLVASVLLGNKVDLQENRKISTGAGVEFAKRHNMAFLETSALTNMNVEKAFETLVRMIFKHCSANRPENGVTELPVKGVKLEPAKHNKPKKKLKCCYKL